MVSSKKAHIPKEDELNTAISSALQENELANVKDIRQVILKRHRNWRLPERRVAKFVKRQQLTVMPWEQTDDELSKSSSAGSSIKRAKTAVSSAVKGTGRGLKKVLTFNRSNKSGADHNDDATTQSSTPPTEIITDRRRILPVSPCHTPDSKEGGLEFFTPTNTEKGTETVKVTGLASRSAAAEETKDAYADDNDGKRRDVCEPCEGCCIL